MALTVFGGPARSIINTLKKISQKDECDRKINTISQEKFNRSVNNMIAQNYTKPKVYHIFENLTYEDFMENPLMKDYFYDFSKSGIAKKFLELYKNQFSLQLLYIDKKDVKKLYSDLKNTFVNYEFKKFLKEDFYCFYAMVDFAYYYDHCLFFDDSLMEKNFIPNRDCLLEELFDVKSQETARISCDLYYRQITKKDD